MSNTRGLFRAPLTVAGVAIAVLLGPSAALASALDQANSAPLLSVAAPATTTGTDASSRRATR